MLRPPIWRWFAPRAAQGVRPVREVVYDMMNEFVDAMTRVCKLLDE